MDTATTKTRSPAGPSTPSAKGRARKKDRGRERSRLVMPLRWLRGKLSSAAGWVHAHAGRGLIRLVRRTAGWLRAQVKSPVRLVKSVFMATIGKDRGFGFWWLVVTAAIALAIGLLVAVLVSPVIGILAALIVGIWMLVRRSRSPQSRQAASNA